MASLEEKFRDMHRLSREERLQLNRDLQIERPDFLRPYVPKWWWWRNCKIKVLIVCDGGLNFGTGDFGISEFLTTFNELETQYPWINYEVTLAHRGAAIMSPNPVVVQHISNFNFATSVTLNNFDQMWLFAISPGSGLAGAELTAVTNFMNAGGGVFATGDHGTLGSAMCSTIPRVKDMRYWDNTSPNNDTNEVSMSGRRRNDTNRPAAGDSLSLYFDNQSDEIPQTIAVRTFSGGNPHPLLAIKTSVRPSGIIDIMPDHPHEGECKPETSFTVNSTTVPTQIIATSFVLGGSSTSGGLGKAATDPHCFPSIAVWDGWQARAGRIVVDSTWHHFVNINLNGVGSGSDRPVQTGLTTADFEVIRQYYMNIARWMSRRKFCIRPYVLNDLLKNSQILEASLDDPRQKMTDISLADLNSIGALAEEILAGRYNAVYAREFLIELMDGFNPAFAEMLNEWRPQDPKEKEAAAKGFYRAWMDTSLLLHTTIGAGFVALRDDKEFSSEDLDEKGVEGAYEIFQKGMEFGFNAAFENMEQSMNFFRDKMKR